MEENCIFCKIIKKEIPSSLVYENEYVYAFNDINPMAPIHVLVIPKVHVEDLEALNAEHDEYILQIHKAFKEIAKITGVSEKGYRIVVNCKDDAGQEVKHLHYHFLAGKKLGMKMD